MKIQKSNAIGILDSGLGGLTVAKEVMRQLPRETIYYFGDSLRCPYGSRSADEVYRFTVQVVKYLMGYPLKVLLIACNTATAVALDQIKDKWQLPIVGVIEPGARAAIKVSKSGSIGVIGTEATIRSNAYEEVLKRLHPEVKVHSLACPTLAPLVEKGINNVPYAQQIVHEALEPLQKLDFDTLILGCTHYPLLNGLINKALDQDIIIISSAQETAREVSTILSYQDLLSEEMNLNTSHHFFTTGEPDLFKQIAEKWLEIDINVERVELNIERN